MSQSLQVPGALRRGALRGKPEEYVQSGAALVALLCARLGLADLGATAVLDMGCGTKITEALQAGSLPIGRYVGIDVYREMIEHLRREVRDSRFAYFHMDTHNAMYNPSGVALSPDTCLPVPEADFDLICLFSVFTHLAPHDYVAMLRLLRRYIKPAGKLLFSLYINEQTPGGHGLIDGISRTLARSPDAAARREASSKPDFVDAGETPLQWALYSRGHAFELLSGTGWVVDSLNDPELHIQHYFICSPA